ncbi:MAG: hypothetical protein HN348_22275 [Proteobacteria bacterium]|nr:hypothetical protein [Pseudomonadota bacterium]
MAIYTATMKTLWLVMTPLLVAGCDVGGLVSPVSNLVLDEEIHFEGLGILEENDLVIRVDNTGLVSAEVLVTLDNTMFIPPSEPVTIASGDSTAIFLVVEPISYEPLQATMTLSSRFETIDIEVLATIASDGDGDGFHARGAGGMDCDDQNPDIFPGATEVCDGVDNNCDRVTDNVNDPPLWYLDQDGDEYGQDEIWYSGCFGLNGFVDNSLDCNDDDDSIHPDAKEVYYDGVDQNCDNRHDYDRDEDGYAAELYGGLDCNDQNDGISPDALENYYDGIDQNCDGLSDFDADGDGWDVEPQGDDCNDSAAEIYPGGIERDDGIDQDCDGKIDEGFIDLGDLIVTEVLLDPEQADDVEGQYIEILNLSQRDVYLSEVIIGSLDGFDYLNNVWLGPGEMAVYCSSTRIQTNGGIQCNGKLPAVLGDDDWLKLEFDSLVVDEVDWGSWQTPLPGYAWELSASKQDGDLNDDETSWCLAQNTFGDGDYGSPGSANSCP